MIWKVFAFAESKLSTQFIAELTCLRETQVIFILESHREIYEAIISGRIKALIEKEESKL